MWKRIIGLVIVASVAAILVVGQAADQPTAPEKKKAPPVVDKKVKELMARKLQHAQNLLGALTTNDLNTVAKESEALLRISKEASWHVYKTKEYEMWSREFSAATEEILKAAKENNSDAAKLRYLQTTLTCFHCHTYVRDIGDIGFEKPRY